MPIGHARRLLGPLLALALVLAGCTNPYATSTPAGTNPAQNPGEPVAQAAPSAASQTPESVQSTPQRALAQFAHLYTNWTWQTLPATQRALATISVGAARLAESQAARASSSDTTLRRAHVFNRGQTISIAPHLNRTGTWVIVTREQTSGDQAEYQDLPATYHIALATLARVPGGWAVSTWQPQT